MQISVVLPSYNAQDLLPKTLNCLSAQQFEGDYEIVVVDCSEGPEVQHVCAQFPQVRFHHETQRFNPGRGRNIGASLATGQLLIFLDADVSLESDALRQAWQFYLQGDRVFGGALELDTEAGATAASYFEHFFFNHESQRGRPACRRSNLSSALMLFERELFLKEGGFSDIPRMQDTELTERMIRQGHTLSFYPKVVGRQIQDAPLAKVLRKIFINGKNLYYIRYSNLSRVRKMALFLALPLIGGFKVMRIILRHLRYQDLHGKWVTIWLIPLLLLGGSYWVGGLYASFLWGGGIGTSRD